MKKILAIALSLVLLLSAVYVSIPFMVSADAETPIKATPITDWTRGENSWQYATSSTVNPLNWLEAPAIKLVPATAHGTTSYEAEYTNSSKVYSQAILTEQTAAFADGTALMFYIELDAGNTFMPSIYANVGWDIFMTMKSGTTYSYAAEGAESWTVANTVNCTNDESAAYNYGISFADSFKGYVKIDLTTLGCVDRPNWSSSIVIKEIRNLIKGVGDTYGNIVIGPYFLVTTDSTSTEIEVPAEYLPKPIEATPIVNWASVGAAGTTASGREMPLSYTTAEGIVVKATANKEVETLNEIRFWINFSESQTLNDILLYVEFEKANIIQIRNGTDWKWLQAGTTYEYMALGDSKWSEGTITSVGIEFDSAFKGYIKLDRSVNNASTSAFTQLLFYLKRIGTGDGSESDYGAAVIAPIFNITKDSSSTEIVVPEEYRTKPIEATPISYNQTSGAAGGISLAQVETPCLVKAKGISAKPSGAALEDTLADLNNIRFWYNFSSSQAVDSILLYVDIPKANILDIRYNVGSWTRLVEGVKYEYAALGDKEWSEGTVQAQGIVFDKAFKGYIKFTRSQINASATAFTQMLFYLKGLGTGTLSDGVTSVDYGNVVIGPVFQITKNSNSTEIIVPDEYKPEPMKVNAITDFTTMGYSWNYTSSKEVTPLDFTSAKGVSLTTYQWLENGFYELPAGSAMKTAKSYACSVLNTSYDIVGTEGIVMYLKTSGPQTVYPLFNMSSGSKSFEAALASNADFKYAAKGDQGWHDGNAVFGGADGDTTNKNVGAIYFDKAFEGYIYMPLSSLVNASGTALSTYSQALVNRIDARIKGTGGAYGDVVIAGPYFSVTAFSRSTELELNNLLGDINRDSIVNEADITVLRKYMLGTDNAFAKANGNVSKDAEGIIDILDLVKTVDYADNTVYAADVYYKSNGALNVSEGARSFSTFVYLPETFNTASTRRAGVILGNYSGSGTCFNLEVKNNGNPRIYHVGAKGSLDWTVNANIQTGDFAHLVFTIDADGNGVCYINGEVVGTKTGITTFDPSIINAEFFIGGDKRSGNTNYFKGRIGEIAIYSDVLTPNEVSAITAAGTAKGTDGLAAFYDVSGTSAGGSVVDEAGANAKFEPYTTFFNDSDVAPYEYSFAVVGDTQSLTRSYSGDFPKIYDWILANKTSKNIQYVFGLGDITDGDTDAEWLLAEKNISKLNGNIAYSLTRGNHDSPEKMDAHFANETYMSQFGGFFDDGDDSTYEGKTANSWRTFKAGNTDYLFVTLDFMSSTIGETNGIPNTELSVEKQAEILAWAKAIIDAHPDHKVIISTHNYVQANGSVTGSHAIESELVAKCPNVYMVLGGHISSDTIIVNKTTYDAGHTVTSLLIDPQQSDLNHGGLGLVAMLYFHADGSVSVQYYSTVRDQYFLRANQFTLN